MWRKFIQKSKTECSKSNQKQENNLFWNKDNIGKPKELWKTLKSLGLSNKTSYSSKFCLKKEDTLNFDDKTNSAIFNDFFVNLAENLVSKLPSPPNKFGLTSVRSYYEKNFDQENTNFKFSPISKDDVMKILCDLKTDKAAGIDNISCKFLKDGVIILDRKSVV